MRHVPVWVEAILQERGMTFPEMRDWSFCSCCSRDLQAERHFSQFIWTFWCHHNKQTPLWNNHPCCSSVHVVFFRGGSGEQGSDGMSLQGLRGRAATTEWRQRTGLSAPGPAFTPVLHQTLILESREMLHRGAANFFHKKNDFLFPPSLDSIVFPIDPELIWGWKCAAQRTEWPLIAAFEAFSSSLNLVSASQLHRSDSAPSSLFPSVRWFGFHDESCCSPNDRPQTPLPLHTRLTSSPPTPGIIADHIVIITEGVTQPSTFDLRSEEKRDPHLLAVSRFSTFLHRSPFSDV